MHIGIDARFTQGHTTGVANYLINLLKSLSRIDRENNYSIFLSKLSYKDRVPEANNFQIRVNAQSALIWKNLWLPREAKKTKIDLIHFPAYTGSFVNIGNNVVTIHDLIHKVNPEWFSRKELLLIDLPIRIAIHRAKKIIAVSESTKRDIIRYYGVKDERIKVTLEAADSSFQPINDSSKIEYIKNKYGLDVDFILYVGVLFKRRNLDRLLEAFWLLKQKTNIGHKLVIVGPGKDYFNLEQLISKFGLDDDVLYLGYVQQSDMPLLYNAASFFVYPSLYEGFGLPVLEAMSCAKAVITSNTSSLPEVIGDTGLLVNPYNSEELYQAMLRLIKDASLRKSLGRQALRRAQSFSWDKMAEQTIDIYQDAIRHNGR